MQDISKTFEESIKDACDKVAFSYLESMTEEQTNRLLDRAIDVSVGDRYTRDGLAASIYKLIIDKVADRYMDENYVSMVDKLNLNVIEKLLHMKVAEKFKV